MKKFKIAYLLLLLLVLIGCGKDNNIEIFRFVNHENKIQIGDTIYLQLIMGEYPADAKVTYLVSEEGIISIEDGFVTGLQVGEVTVRATVDNIKFATTKVIVEKEPIDGLQILTSKKNANDNLPNNTIYIDNEFNLSVKIFPSHLSNEVTWSIEIGEDVAVIENGVLKPLRGEKDSVEFGNGGAKVRVVATSVEDPTFSAKKDLYIRYRPTQSITVSASQTTFELEDIISGEVESVVLNVTVSPANANPLLTFLSSDNSIALVNNYGVVTFPTNPKAGSVVITVTSLDGKSATITLTINDANNE